MNPVIYFFLFLFMELFKYVIEAINGWIQVLESMW